MVVQCLFFSPKETDRTLNFKFLLLLLKGLLHLLVRLVCSNPSILPVPVAHRRPLDFGFLVDSAPDISDQQWQKILWYMRNVIDSLHDISLEPYGTRVGIISYASVSHLHLDFNLLWGPNFNKDRLKDFANSLHRQPGNERRIDNAVDFARTNLFSSKGGVRPGSQRVCISKKSIFW